ncbi:aa3-type cytochrome c oxidase subunit IV [Solirhodobacter olei]|nr:aa3-type cytochrome c oxidase subunit IV [Solirhodobacter olei]
MAGFEHGSMDIRDHQKTFDGFVKMVTWGGIIVVCVLIFVGLVNG